ncbi:MAG: hypothetical protein ABIZ49_04165 [Opitutaceae bacterium]
MTNPRLISGRVWIGFASSVLLCGTVVWFAHRARPVQPANAVKVAALNAERESLQSYDDRIRDHLRDQQQRLARLAWTPATLAALQQRLGAGWRWTWAPGDQPSRVTLQRVAPQLEEWTVYGSLVAELAGQPGVIIESVEILADGSARDRRLTRVVIGLRFIVAVAPARDGQRAAPSPGPPTVAPAESPAATRKVGASTSHRRPSASAEPPAPGTNGASFRSRPSGFQGRRSHKTKTNQPKQI